MSSRAKSDLHNTAPSNASVQAQLDPMASTTAQHNSSNVSSQCLYTGVVAGVDLETRRMTVLIGPGKKLDNCIYLAGVLSSLTGFGTATLPATGTKVLVFHTTNETYVVGATGGKPEKIQHFKGRATASDGARTLKTIGEAWKVKRDGKKRQDLNSPVPAGDMLPGELELTNNLGVALRLCQDFAQLDAGGLARIEANLLNDMVRIVDSYYVHHSCAGDDMIWTNGYTTDEQHRTSYQYEADSKVKESDPMLSPGKTAPIDVGKSAEAKNDESPYSATGRWRWSRYKGFLGDFVHTFVTNPTKVTSTYHKEALRGGNFRSWIGSDGTYMVQAAGGIHLEVRKNISIPQILKAWNDPEFDAAAAYKSLDDTYLQIWGAKTDWTDLVVSCWQLRNYARYLSLFHSLARFRQMEDMGYCKVFGEKDALPNSAAAAEGDKSKVNGDKAYVGHASITVDAGGNITLQQGGTTSVVINQGNIQLAAPGNIELVAGGTISLRSKYTALVSALDTEICSTHGKMTFSSMNSMKFLAQKGRMWFKSDAEKTPKEGLGYSDDFEGDDFSVFGDFANVKELQKYAMIFDTSDGRMLIHSKDELSVASESGDILVQSEAGKTLVSAKQQLQLVAEGLGYSGDSPTRDGSVLVKGGLVAVSAGQAFGMEAPLIDINEQDILVTPGIVEVNTPVTSLRSSSIFMFGNLNSTGSAFFNGTVISVGGFVSPSGVVAKAEDLSPWDPAESDREDSPVWPAVEDAGDLSIGVDGSDYAEVEFADSVWRLRDGFSMSSTVTRWDSLKMPMYSDAAELNGYEDGTVFKEVRLNDTTLLSAARTMPTRPWPGGGAMLFKFDGGLPVLTEPAELPDEKVIVGVKEMTGVQYHWKGLYKSTGGDVDVLYRFASIPRDTEPPTGP